MVRGEATGNSEPVRGLTYYENPRKKGSSTTIMIPGFMAKVDKTVPLVNKGDIIQAYEALPTNAKQELLTIVDPELASRMFEIDIRAKRQDVALLHQQHPRPKTKRLVTAFYGFNSTKLMQDILDSSGAQALTHDRSVKPDVLQPKYHTVLSGTLLPFIQDRCSDFLANTKRMRSRMVRRKELWYRLADFAMEESKHVVVDGLVAQAVECRILNEYYKDKFASIRKKYAPEAPIEELGTPSDDGKRLGNEGKPSKKRPSPSKAKQASTKRQPASLSRPGNLSNQKEPTFPRTVPLAGQRHRSKSSSSSSSSSSSASSSSSSSSVASFLFNAVMTSEGTSSDTSSMSSDFSETVSSFEPKAEGAPRLPLLREPVPPPVTGPALEVAPDGEWHVVGKTKAKKGPQVSSLMSPRRVARRKAAARAAAAAAEEEEEAAAAAAARKTNTFVSEAVGANNVKPVQSIDLGHTDSSFHDARLQVKRTFIHIDEEPTDECLQYHPGEFSKEAPF